MNYFTSNAIEYLTAWTIAFENEFFGTRDSLLQYDIDRLQRELDEFERIEPSPDCRWLPMADKEG